MRPVLLDTNFILTCIRQKIDFFENLENEGFHILIPKEVIEELKDLSKFKSEAKTALKLLEKSDYKEINLGARNVDTGIIKYAKENPRLIIATLDNEIKNKIKNPRLIIRGKKKLEVI